ncbi:methionyl-tRNA formyltransferase, mitochondrial isoform X2 [Anabrus simplex]|uniref:methionyl-tRNA formyltransferase, mitochondrial isoform X2 n=1 Tax=Anabrus simplex TaxID=316456 RepID=UPI0035A27D96
MNKLISAFKLPRLMGTLKGHLYEQILPKCVNSIRFSFGILDGQLQWTLSSISHQRRNVSSKIPVGSSPWRVLFFGTDDFSLQSLKLLWKVLGMLNVHASLLPRWRGAAPIIHCIRNGDVETGVTVMQIQPHKFDIGGIVCQSRYHLSPHDDLPSVTKGLGQLGAQLLIECLQDLPHCLNEISAQPSQGVTYAPRVTAALSVVNWKGLSANEVYNLYRALVGVFPLSTKWHELTVKLYKASLSAHSKGIEKKYVSCRAGYVVYDWHSKLLVVKCCDGQWIGFRNVSVPRKKMMTPADFYNGYISKQTEEEWYFT